MRKNANIEINGFYTCKVTNKEVTVQITASSPKGGWEALNTVTGKKLHIKGPERLIKKVAAQKAKGKTSKAVKPSKMVVPVTQAPPKKKAVKKVTPKKAVQQKTAKPSKDKLSLLDATAIVLKKQSPLTCKQLIERMAEAELWKSESATPANTLHAALSKEIRVKGKDSRFEKVDRGQFGLKSEK